MRIGEWSSYVFSSDLHRKMTAIGRPAAPSAVGDAGLPGERSGPGDLWRRYRPAKQPGDDSGGNDMPALPAQNLRPSTGGAADPGLKQRSYVSCVVPRIVWQQKGDRKSTRLNSSH